VVWKRRYCLFVHARDAKKCEETAQEDEMFAMVLRQRRDEVMRCRCDEVREDMLRKEEVMFIRRFRSGGALMCGGKSA